MEAPEIPAKASRPDAAGDALTHLNRMLALLELHPQGDKARLTSSVKNCAPAGPCSLQGSSRQDGWGEESKAGACRTRPWSTNVEQLVWQGRSKGLQETVFAEGTEKSLHLSAAEMPLEEKVIGCYA